MLTQLLCLIQATGITASASQADAPRNSGPTPSRTFGEAIAGIGDTNEDGFADFLVSDPGLSGGAFRYREYGQRGRLWLISGRDGSTLRTFDSEYLDDGFGRCLDCVGDLNADGVQEFIVGTNDFRPGEPGYSKVFCGRTGGLLFRLDGEQPNELFGAAVAGVGDLNADGVPDLAVGTPGLSLDRSIPRTLSFFSGEDASLLFRLEGDSGDWNFGRFVVGVGDANADAHDDVVVVRGRSSEGYNAQLYSGANGSLLWSSASIIYEADWTACSGGDYDADGVNDVFIGLLDRLLILSGKDGEELATREACLDGPLAVLIDGATSEALKLLVTQDSYSFFIGRVQLVLVATGRVLYEVPTATDTWHFGASLSPIGDIDGDGHSDFAVGSDTVKSGAGDCQVWVFSGLSGAGLFDLRCEAGVVRRAEALPIRTDEVWQSFHSVSRVRAFGKIAAVRML